MFPLELTLCSAQWLLFSRNIGYLTLKIIYLHYLKKSFLDQSIQKIVYLILKKEALALHLVRLSVHGYSHCTMAP